MPGKQGGAKDRWMDGVEGQTPLFREGRAD
jgi:hypothetical protein